ncbi:hypothetical protein WQ57_20925 [Mesobacillus campisalis]|uniref:Uncharacterized protein n=1 Tax=Mesobacillus campisalis TaxID=1408103 RepID=A0A0M2ST19_9BACI|nr:hypothetical protein WQ57_20925 [Mesobacillus campisalis]
MLEKLFEPIFYLEGCLLFRTNFSREEHHHKQKNTGANRSYRSDGCSPQQPFSANQEEGNNILGKMRVKETEKMHTCF